MNDAGPTDERDFHGGELTSAGAGAKRKPLFSATVLAATLAGLTACSTPGSPHAYLYSPAVNETTVRDIDLVAGAENAQIPAFLEEGERVLGLAYDPYTDHLYLRIFPGNVIRVVDRPAARVKRMSLAPNLPLGGHDLTIRSRDRHLFFTDSTAPALIETDLHGALENYIPLTGLKHPPWGVAYDARVDEFLILPEQTSERVLRYSLSGLPTGEVNLECAVQGISLAYDSVEHRYLASLVDGSAIGVFDQNGRLLRTLSRPAAEREVFIDVGARSLLRLF